MADDPYENFRPGTFSRLIWKIGRGHHVPAAELAEALVQNRGKVIPAEILDYLVATLRGEIKKPSGRKAKDDLASFERR